jgi:hypothetical protein
MTNTTDLQKPFTDEQLKAASQRPSWCKTCEANEMCPTLAKAVLVERYRLAARVIELEAENKRLREGLSGAHASLKTAAMEARHHPELRALYTKWADEASAALKGREK